jgi:DNA repair exonuclease SbcCD ATPase subunit
MRFIRLRLTNYRGIKNSELEFARDGLTIIEGPNEAGKTSHVEAIRLLFEYKDNTRNAEVKAIKPVDKDVGSKIELEAETGPYVFKYCKQFNKGNQTSLTITQPSLENFTGYDAHQRAEKILDETLDVHLWKALCIQQGEPIQQANLSKQESLSKVLDHVAVGSRSNNEEEGLLEKVKLEYERYFTELGSFKSEILKNQDRMLKVSEEIKLLTRQIDDLEKYCNDIEQAKEEIESQIKLKRDLERDETKYSDLLKEITD